MFEILIMQWPQLITTDAFSRMHACYRYPNCCAEQIISAFPLRVYLCRAIQTSFNWASLGAVLVLCFSHNNELWGDARYFRIHWGSCTAPLSDVQAQPGYTMLRFLSFIRVHSNLLMLSAHIDKHRDAVNNPSTLLRGGGAHPVPPCPRWWGRRRVLLASVPGQGGLPGRYLPRFPAGFTASTELLQLCN